MLFYVNQIIQDDLPPGDQIWLVVFMVLKAFIKQSWTANSQSSMGGSSTLRLICGDKLVLHKKIETSTSANYSTVDSLSFGTVWFGLWMVRTTTCAWPHSPMSRATSDIDVFLYHGYLISSIDIDAVSLALWKYISFL